MTRLDWFNRMIWLDRFFSRWADLQDSAFPIPGSLWQTESAVLPMSHCTVSWFSARSSRSRGKLAGKDGSKWFCLHSESISCNQYSLTGVVTHFCRTCGRADEEHHKWEQSVKRIETRVLEWGVRLMHYCHE